MIVNEAPVTKEAKSQGSFMERLDFWKLATAKCGCLSILAACSSIAASLNGIVKFSDLTPVQITLGLVALVSAVVAVILAFLSDTMQTLKAKADAERQAASNKPVT